MTPVNDGKTLQLVLQDFDELKELSPLVRERFRLKQLLV